MLKKVALMLLAMALPMSVLPVPGGPNSSRPLGGARAPCTDLHVRRSLVLHRFLSLQLAAARGWLMQMPAHCITNGACHCLCEAHELVTDQLMCRVQSWSAGHAVKG